MAVYQMSDEARERIRGLWPAVLGALASGALVRDVLAIAGMTDDAKRIYLTTEPGAQAEWDNARECSADAFMDEALDCSRDEFRPVIDPITKAPAIGPDGKPLIVAADSALTRVRIDTLKWAARIRNPRLYGDKAQLDVNVRSVDLTQIINNAQARLDAQRQVGNAALLGAIEGQAVRLLEQHEMQPLE